MRVGAARSSFAVVVTKVFHQSHGEGQLALDELQVPLEQVKWLYSLFAATCTNAHSLPPPLLPKGRGSRAVHKRPASSCCDTARQALQAEAAVASAFGLPEYHLGQASGPLSKLFGITTGQTPIKQVRPTLPRYVTYWY